MSDLFADDIDSTGHVFMGDPVYQELGNDYAAREDYMREAFAGEYPEDFAED